MSNTPENSKVFEKFRDKMRELFQMNRADLDFGMYRIMNAKRDEINEYLDKELYTQVGEILQKYSGKDKNEKIKELEEAKKQAEDLGVDPAQSRKVQELEQEIAQAVDTDDLERKVYSHLYTFFSRYYDNGDFISKRRYKDGAYMIPYEGEEVKLVWANMDQYYIKTSEYLRDYSFFADFDKKRRVHFKLTEAEESKDNTKTSNGSRRFALADDPVSTQDGELLVRFVYKEFPKGKDKQEDINKATIETILGKAEDFKPFLERLVSDKSTRRVIDKHVNEYTARNSYDYFIHKDLAGFLKRELDFYIKNEVMRIEDIDSEESISRVEAYLDVVRALKLVGEKIISFLAHIEEFQKKLWLKKKFVIDSGYCVTMDKVPEELWDEVANNKEQEAEWKKLGFLENTKKVSKKWLKENSYAMIDTKFYDKKFKNTLLDSFENIDEQTDGLIINSENFQALNLLQERYKEKVKCVYIDPPYNTEKDRAEGKFLYKDSYEHSSWLSFLGDRYLFIKNLLNEKGAIFTSIDDDEHHRLNSLQETIFGKDNFVSNIIWQKKFSPQNDATRFSDNHDFITCFAKDKTNWFPNLLPRKEENDSRYKNPDNDPRGLWASSDMTVKTYSADYDYEIITPSGRKVKPTEGRCWFTSKENMDKLIKDNRIWFGEKGKNVPRIKTFLSEVKQGITPLTVWTFDEVGHNQEGRQETIDLFGSGEMIRELTPKVVKLIKKVSIISANENDLIGDYFAGSGTTGHAVITLNREDGGNRKYILVEMGQYFDTVLKPRIQKVVYADTWKNGKPVSKDDGSTGGSSYVLKYLKLESYEDTLNNLEVRSSGEYGKLKELGSGGRDFREGFMLNYFIDHETGGTELSTSVFNKPFEYELAVATGNVGETKPVKVDLVETFNYLIGLEVRQRWTARECMFIEGIDAEENKVLIVWRDIDIVNNEKLAEIFKKQEIKTRDREYDLIYVNGDNNVENIRFEEERWKVRLIEHEFRNRMFSNTQGQE